MRSAGPPLAIVVAVGRNGVIGQEGALPWRLPSDLARFRELTMGKPMIMGRRTFDSIGRVLPGRESIVVSRQEGLRLPAGAHLAATPRAALDLAAARAAAMGANEISLIGGATLFDALLAETERIYLTRVDLEPDGDTFFPEIDLAVWRETARIRPVRRFDDAADCLFLDYRRR